MKKTRSGNPAVTIRAMKLKSVMRELFDLVQSLENHISEQNHLIMKSTALGLMRIVDPEGRTTIVSNPSKSFDKIRAAKSVFGAMRTCVELTKVPDDLTDEQFLDLRCAAFGLMFVYSELSGLPDPVEVIFKDLVVEEQDKAWANKPANQNKLLRRKVEEDH